MRKADVETYYEHGTTYPAVNVKCHLWLPDLFRKFEGVQARSKFICRTCEYSGRNGSHDDGARDEDHRFRPGGPYHVHEFGDDAGFWEWLHSIEDEYDHEAFDWAEEFAREECWEQAQDDADQNWEHLPFRFGDNRATHPVKVWQFGRSGGWLCVEGLPDVDEWDAIAVARWAKFEKWMRSLAFDEYPYKFIWHLHANYYEPKVEAPRLQAEADALNASLPVTLNA